MKTAIDILNEIEPKPYEPKARYYKHGEFITYFYNEKPCLARQLNKNVTVFYNKEDDKEIVGFKVYL